ncbi:50S ribosomal protein L4 [Candidatus Micrarchaeota archaeon]|nr:50S ribosomal protein L4 [Candidatus Micrarchaeota archaeon]
MKANVYSVEGKKLKTIDLPPQFDSKYREDLIRRAVLSDESAAYQPKGNYRFAGMETSAKYRGRKEAYGSLKNKGQAMLPRTVVPGGGMGVVRRIPSSVKGRRAHPPKPEKKIIELINKKEYAKALRSALASTMDKEMVAELCGKEIEVPFILETGFEKISKTKEIIKVLDALKISDLVAKAKNKRKKKTGVRKKRKKQITKSPKYIILVVSEQSAVKAAKNIPGLKSVLVKDMKVNDLVPGAKAGRVTIFTENALKEISEKW